MGSRDWRNPCGEREPSNVKDKFAVAIMKNGVVVGHLKKGQSGWFAKTISYFLKAAESNSCNVKITGHRVNLGGNQGLQVPCIIQLRGDLKYIKRLREALEKHNEL